MLESTSDWHHHHGDADASSNHNLNCHSFSNHNCQECVKHTSFLTANDNWLTLSQSFDRQAYQNDYPDGPWSSEYAAQNLETGSSRAHLPLRKNRIGYQPDAHSNADPAPAAWSTAAQVSSPNPYVSYTSLPLA